MSLVYMKNVRSRAWISRGLHFSQSLLRNLGSQAVGRWSFEEGSGSTVYDQSGFENDGIISGASFSNETPHKIVGPGGSDYSLQFNGSSDYVRVPLSSSFNITDAITIEAWIKHPSSVGSAVGIVDTQQSGNRGYRLCIENDVVEFGIYGGDLGQGYTELNGKIPVTDGGWHHLVGTWDGLNMRIYVDGKEDTSAVQSAMAESQQDLYIGVRDVNAGWFEGLIDEVRIYNESLELTTIKKHYTQGFWRNNLR